MENITLAIQVMAKIISPLFTTGEGLFILIVFGLTTLAWKWILSFKNL